MRSEREKMLAGELYDPAEPVLAAAARRAQELCAALNLTAPGDEAGRRRICKDLFGTGGDTVRLRPPFFCDYGSHIHLGESVYFNVNCVVLDVCEVKVGDFTLFGPAVQIYTPLHPLEPMVRRFVEYGKPVEIGSDVWVSGGAIICPGVRIGDRSIIGAGSVVTRDIPDGVLAVGNPCRVIRELAGGEGPRGGGGNAPTDIRA